MEFSLSTLPLLLWKKTAMLGVWAATRTATRLSARSAASR